MHILYNNTFISNIKYMYISNAKHIYNINLNHIYIYINIEYIVVITIILCYTIVQETERI